MVKSDHRSAPDRATPSKNNNRHVRARKLILGARKSFLSDFNFLNFSTLPIVTSKNVRILLIEQASGAGMIARLDFLSASWHRYIIYIFVLFTIAAGWGGAFILDDAYITLHNARSLLNGYDPTYGVRLWSGRQALCIYFLSPLRD